MEALTPALLFAIGSAIGWSVLDLARRFLADRVGALALVAWSTLGALPLLALWVAWTGATAVGEGYLLPAFASIGLNVVANLAYFRSLQVAPLSETLPLLSLTPVCAAILGGLFLGERVTPRGALGIALVVVGALLLTMRIATSEATGRYRVQIGLGARLMAVVALCWSATLFLDKLAVRAAAPELHALVLNLGVAVAAIAILGAKRQLATMRAIRGRVVWLCVAIAVGALALSLQLMALVSLPIGMIETLKRGLGALLALALGRLLFAEPVTAPKLVAVLLLTSGVAMILL